MPWARDTTSYTASAKLFSSSLVVNNGLLGKRIAYGAYGGFWNESAVRSRVLGDGKLGDCMEWNKRVLTGAVQAMMLLFCQWKIPSHVTHKSHGTTLSKANNVAFPSPWWHCGTLHEHFRQLAAPRAASKAKNGM